MSRERIYKKAFQSLIDGDMSIDGLWKTLKEHFDMLDETSIRLKKDLDKYKSAYENLLGKVNEAHKEHENYVKNNLQQKQT